MPTPPSSMPIRLRHIPPLPSRLPPSPRYLPKLPSWMPPPTRHIPLLPRHVPHSPRHLPTRPSLMPQATSIILSIRSVILKRLNFNNFIKNRLLNPALSLAIRHICTPHTTKTEIRKTIVFFNSTPKIRTNFHLMRFAAKTICKTNNNMLAENNFLLSLTLSKHSCMHADSFKLFFNFAVFNFVLIISRLPAI